MTHILDSASPISVIAGAIRTTRRYDCPMRSAGFLSVWPWLLGAVLAPLAGAAIGWSCTKPVYRSVARVYFDIPGRLRHVSPPAHFLEQQARSAQDAKVASGALTDPAWTGGGDGRSAASFARSLTTSVASGEIIEIVFTASSPATAQAGAQAASSTYASLHQSEYLPQKRTRAIYLQDEDSRLSSQLARCDARLLEVAQQHGTTNLEQLLEVRTQEMAKLESELGGLAGWRAATQSTSLAPATRARLNAYHKVKTDVAAISRSVAKFQELMLPREELSKKRRIVRDELLENIFMGDARVIDSGNLPIKPVADNRQRNALIGAVGAFTLYMALCPFVRPLRKQWRYFRARGAFEVIIPPSPI